jgi:hypothetical protein
MSVFAASDMTIEHARALQELEHLNPADHPDS